MFILDANMVTLSWSSFILILRVSSSTLMVLSLVSDSYLTFFSIFTFISNIFQIDRLFLKLYHFWDCSDEISLILGKVKAICLS